MKVPTPQAWHAASWRAREQWAREHGMSTREATRLVTERRPRLRPTLCAVPDNLDEPIRHPRPVRRASARDVDTTPPTMSDDAYRASLAGDGDALTVAIRRAVVTGLPLTSEAVLVGLPLDRDEIRPALPRLQLVRGLAS